MRALNCLRSAPAIVPLGFVSTAGLAAFGVAPAWQLGGVVLLLCAGWIVLIVSGSADVSSTVRCRCWMGVLMLGTLLAAALLFRPEGRWDGGNDDGLYANVAVHLAKTGSSVVESSAFASVPEGLLKLFIGRRPVQAQPGGADLQQLWGPANGAFFVDQSAITDAPAGGAQEFGWAIQFPNGMPVWLAGWFVLGGYEGLAAGAFILLPIVAWQLGRMMMGIGGGWVGVGTGLLVMTNPLMVWLANTHFAELLVAACWLAALGYLGQAGKGATLSGAGAAWWGAAAASVKVEGLLLAAGLSIVALWFHGSNRRFVVAYAVGWIVALPCVAAAYGPVGGLNALDTMLSFLQPKALLLLIMILCTGFLAWVFRHRMLALVIQPKTRLVAAGLCIIGLLWFGLWRPTFEAGHLFYYWPAEQEILSWRAFTFQRLSWYQMPWGLVGMSVGVVLAILLAGRPIRRSAGIEAFALFGVTIIFGALYFYDIRNNPVQPYAMRRLVPVVLPGFLAASLWGWNAFGDRLRSSWKQWGVKGTALAVMTAGQLWGLSALRAVQPDPGMAEPLSALASQLPGNAAVVVFNDAVGRRLATPLVCLAGLDTLQLQHGSGYDPQSIIALRKLSLSMQKAGRPLYWLKIQQRCAPGQSGMLVTSYRRHLAEGRPEGVIEERLSFQWMEVTPSFHPRQVSAPTEPTDAEDGGE